GLTFGTLMPGSTVHMIAKASASGYLQGWIDWNNDGNFNGDNERVLTNKGLIAGNNDVTFTVPASANVNTVYARFRFGSFGTNSIFGLDPIGEVEDYKLSVAVPVVAQVVGFPADTDGDGDVDGFDFLAWQRNVGKTSGATTAQGDSTGDG